MMKAIPLVVITAMLMASSGANAAGDALAAKIFVAAALGNEGDNITGSSLNVADDGTFSGTIDTSGDNGDLQHECRGKIKAGEVIEHDCTTSGGSDGSSQTANAATETLEDVALAMVGEGAKLVSSAVTTETNGSRSGTIIVSSAGDTYTFACKEVYDNQGIMIEQGCGTE